MGVFICINFMSKSTDRPLSLQERLFHATLFEIGAIFLTMLVFKLFNNHNLAHTGLLAVVISLLAVIWNMIFNWAFDQVVTGNRLDRSFGTRLIHMALFEGGLFLATVPMIAWSLQVSLWQAFMMDIGIVAVIGVYTLMFNWVYDWLRHKLLNKAIK